MTSKLKLRLGFIAALTAAFVIYFNACSNTSSSTNNTTTPTPIRDLTITVTSGPADGGVSAATTAFTFSVAAGTPTFTCTLDSTPLGSCDPAGVALAGLAQGLHTLTIQATDAEGAGPATTITWTVDTTGPALTILTPSDGAVVASTFSMQFISDDSAATYECTIDGAPFSCTAGASNNFSSIASGAHLIAVTGTDNVGNQSQVQITVTVP